MKMKMYIIDKIFDKIFLKAIKHTFSLYVVCNPERDGMKHEEKG